MGVRAPPWNGPNCPASVASTDGCVASGRLSVLTPSNGARAVGAVPNPITEKILVEDWCNQFPSHMVGTIAFGRDGKLDAGSGDGASWIGIHYGHHNNTSADPHPPKR